jgi:hypothetical protein
MWHTLSIGADYLSGSIRGRSGNQEFRVEEIDPSGGTFRIDLPVDFNEELSVDFQRKVLRGGSPRGDKVIGISDACIYCGARSGLQNEHVIPFGLEGEFVLRNASCGRCATRTSKIELAVLRDTLLPARSALNIRSRRIAKRPATLPLIQHDEEGPVIRRVSVDEHPTYIAFPEFDAPAVLRNAPQPNLILTGVWKRLVGASSLVQASNRLGGAKVSVELVVDIYTFARMLGKIAHGFVAAADLGDVQTELPAAVLSDGEAIGWWVGGAPDVTIEGEGLHGVSLSVVNGEVHVRVRLFAQLGGPEYLVIAGRLIEPPPNNGLPLLLKSLAIPMTHQDLRRRYCAVTCSSAHRERLYTAASIVTGRYLKESKRNDASVLFVLYRLSAVFHSSARSETRFHD